VLYNSNLGRHIYTMISTIYIKKTISDIYIGHIRVCAKQNYLMCALANLYISLVVLLILFFITQKECTFSFYLHPS
jgi:hypothetical protein